LRRKVSALLVLSSVLPLLALAAMLLHRERDMQREGRVALLEARADEVLHTLEAMQRGHLAAARRGARDRDIVAACSAPPALRERAVRAAQVRLEVRGDETGIRGVGVVDRTGRVVAASETALVGLDLGYRKYFQRAVAGAEALPYLYVSVPRAGRTATIAYAAPVRGDDGDIVGVYVLWVRASAIWDVMREANGAAGPGSFHILFDGDGVRIGHSANEQLLFRPAAPLRPESIREMTDERRFQERTAELLRDVQTFPLPEASSGPQAILRHHSTTNGAWNVGVARHSHELGWTLVTLLPERELEAPIGGVLRHVVPIAVVALALALLGGALIIRRVVGPIGALAATAAALERGDFGDGNGLRDLRLRGRDEIGRLAWAFRSMARALALRERTLRARHRDLQLLLDNVGQGFLATDANGEISPERSAILAAWFGQARPGERIWDFLAAGDDEMARLIQAGWGGLFGEGGLISDHAAALPQRLHRGGLTLDVEYRPVLAGGGTERVIVVVSDVTSAVEMEAVERQLEIELRQAQKLEAVGQLASGIAHEINTPVQFISDNTTFLGEAFTSLREVLRTHHEVFEAAGPAPELRRRVQEVENTVDLDYVLEEVPKTIARTLEGVRRVATIVRAMKEFAHPDQKEMVSADINGALLATLEVARNEYKYVADVRLELGEIPRVLCHAGDINQVFLNILVNAAHAIEDVVKGTSARGIITVSTRRDGPEIVVAISDTGGGIADAIRDKVFDPFFTTKEVGRGTGQGLAIARSIVAKHGGQVTFTTRGREGTTFLVRLPIDGPGPSSPGERSRPHAACVDR
jgi:C4-dicarboxylate-specific signal transduction histidine kinase